MAGPDHCRNRSFAALRIANSGAEWADLAALGEAQRGGHRLLLRQFARGAPVFLFDPGKAQLLVHAAPAVAASDERLRFGQCISGIVDIAELRQPPGHALEVGLSRAVPAALADLSGEVPGKLCATRGKPA